MSTAETVTGQSGPGEQRPRTPLTARGGGIGVLAERAALPVAWVALIVIYSFTSPGLFLTWANISNILGSQAVLFVLAIAALMPSLTGDFDLSLGGVMGLVAMVVGVLNTEHHVGIVPACLIGVAVAVAAGCLNGFFVVTCDTNALIVTLGMGSVFTGLIYLLSAAVFLGATTLKPGRFNALGVGIAVYFLATGVNGLQLLGAANYVQQLFYGAALIAAVVLSRQLRRRA